MLAHDIRYALRLLRRSPGFTAAAVLSLALGIGANTAVFSLLYTVMLRPLPVANPEQLVQFLRTTAEDPRNDGYWGWDKYERVRDHNHVFSIVTGMGFDNLASVRTAAAEPETLVLEHVAGNYFPALGLKPAIGRLLGPEDVPASGEGEAVVVSWSYWKRRLRGDPAAIGQRIWYRDHPKTIVGVAPREYVGPRVGVRTDVWMPSERGDVTLLARLKPGATVQQAEAEMGVLFNDRRIRIEVEPAGAGLVRVRDRYGKALAALLAVVGLLLLLASANIASLLLARAAGRQRELAVRVGLGAGRGRLVRQMLTESLLLSGAAMLSGILVAYAGTGALTQIMATGRAFERVEIEVHPDPILLAFTGAVALLTGLLFGLAPAWHAFRIGPASVLRQSGGGDHTRLGRWFGRGLVSAQVALSIVLVTGAAVFVSHLSRLRHFDLGFRSDHVLLVTVNPSGAKPAAPAYREILERFERVPGVISASILGCAPLQGCGLGSRFLTAEGSVEPPETRVRTAIAFVSPRYFETLGVPLLAGRDFRYDAAGPRPAIVNQAMARRYFPGVNPIGKRVRMDGDARPYEIIGLVGDMKTFELRAAPYPAIYFSMFHEGRFHSQFALRTVVDPDTVAGPARHILRDILKTAPVTRVTTLARQVDETLVPERLVATLSAFFAFVAAALAGIGLYGLLAYTVARRTHEIGIRMALGATSGSVRRLVLREVFLLVCAGIAAGAWLVYGARPLAGRLFEDLKWYAAGPLAISGTAIVAVALLAAYLPVRRAARVDPMVALRHE